MLKFLLYTVVAFHAVMVIGNIASIIVIPFIAPWYIVFPLVTYLSALMTTRVNCPLTNLENSIRRKLGMKQIGGFIGHYLYKPFFRKNKHGPTEHT